MKFISLVITCIGLLAGCASINQAQLEEKLKKCGDNQICRENAMLIYQEKEIQRIQAAQILQEYSRRQHELAVARAMNPPVIYTPPQPRNINCQKFGNTINCQSY